MSEDTLPFEILEVLGEGTFGAVCVARMKDDPLRRLVAIKVLKQEYSANPKVLHRFRDEARLLSRLQHPNVVRVEQLIEAEDRPIVVMELVRGLDLKTLIKRYPKGLPVSVAMSCVRLTCVALHVAYHEAAGDDGKPLKVIHRDIKPSNVLLSIHGQVKVVDFGVATGQFQGREARTDSVVMGSRPYMAPERLDRSRDTPAVDIYSAGMTLYELLTGHVMPLSVNPASHDRSMTEHLRDLSPVGMPLVAVEDLRQLIRRMCAYDVDIRPSAREAAAELGRLLDGVDPAHQIKLDDFSRDVVEPLYRDRKEVPLRVAVKQLEDRAFLTEAVRKRPERPLLSPEHHKEPAIFFGAILGLVIGLGLWAFDKAMNAAPEERPRALDMARVKFWFPTDAQARVGSLGLAVPGHLDLPFGATELDLTFRDGRTLACRFDAKEGIAVRYVVDRGVGSISIDDGPATPCERADRPPPRQGPTPPPG